MSNPKLLARFLVVIPLALAGASLLAQNFGAIRIGGAAGLTVTVSIVSQGTLGNVAVLTQGASSLDFTNGGGSCAAGTYYSNNATCTVFASFAPKLPGSRYGAIVLNDKSGAVMATVYLQGVGIGPEVNFRPGTQSSVFPSLDIVQGIGADENGNLYFGNDGYVVKESPSAGGYTQSTLNFGAGSTLASASGIAVDGAGNLYIADYQGGQVIKESFSASTYSQSTVFSGISAPEGIAVDGAGKVYIAATGSGQVVVETPSASGYTQSILPTKGLVSPSGVAVDGSGNVYVLDIGLNLAVKETLSSGAYTQSTIVTGLNHPTDFAVDALGDVYICNFSGGQVLQETPSSSGYTQSTVPFVGLVKPYVTAVDAFGNLFVADYPNFDDSTVVLEMNFRSPPHLSFEAAAIGTPSSDSPRTITVENYGNAALTFPVPASGTNPSVPENFTLGSGEASACPSVEAGSSTPGTLAGGASCLLNISYDPQNETIFSGSLQLTDNDLNAPAPAYATQSLNLSTRSGPPASVAVAIGQSAPGIYGVAVPICAEVQDATKDLLPGVTVNFAGAGLAFSQKAAVTGANGQACTMASGATAGSFTATAAVSGVSASASFPLKFLPAPLTVTVHGNWRFYGAANPSFAVSFAGLVGSDTVTVTSQSTATPASPVGTYPITTTVSGADASNYTITVIEGTLQVRRAPLSVSAKNVAVTYGQTPPPLTAYTLTGFVNGDTASVVSGAPILSTTVTSTTPVGFYPIKVQVGTLAAANYFFETLSNAEGTVGVYKAPLTIRPSSFTIHVGNPLPTFTYTITGFVNGDTQASATTGAPSLTTTAPSTAKPGRFFIIGNRGTLAAHNYNFANPSPATNGILTILP